MKLLKIILVLFFSTPFFCVTTTRQDAEEDLYEAAQTYEQQQNYTEAFKCYYKAAQTNTEAAYKVGLGYLGGIGVEKNTNRAIEILTDLAEKNHTMAACELGKYYETIPNKKYEAKQFYKKAAEAGCCRAMNRFALLRHDDSMFKESKEWLIKAVEEGDIDALYNLGAICTNQEEKIDYFIQAAKKDHPEANYSLGEYYGKNNQTKEKSFEHYKKAADLGHTQAQYEVAHCYGNAKGVAKDIKQMEKYYLLAAEKEEIFAQLKLGKLYSQGYGFHVEQDLEKALLWYERAINNKQFSNYSVSKTDVYLYLGKSYLFGLGTQQNNEQAFLYFDKALEKENVIKSELISNDEKQKIYAFLANSYKAKGVLYKECELKYHKLAAQLGDTQSMIILGDYYLSNDPKTAYEYYLSAVQKNNIIAHTKIAHCLKNGIGVKKNIERACDFEKIALGMGSKEKTQKELYEAFEECELAVKNGEYHRCVELGQLHENAVGTIQDYEEARVAYHQAIDYGYYEGALYMARLYLEGKI